MTTGSGALEFDRYVASHGVGLERYAYALTGDAHAAEDLIQIALMKAYRRWRRIARMEFPDAYVRGIVTTTLLDQRRRRSTTERPVAEIPDSPAGRTRPPGRSTATRSSAP